LFHGLEQKKGKGKLTIRGHHPNAGTLLLEVEDDGIGLSPEELASLRTKLASALDPEQRVYKVGETKSVGLANIEKRIRLTYGAGYGLEINAGAAGGVLVRIRIPYRCRVDIERSVTPASSMP
jgi:two-component system sensor histidine kinase YesM